MAVDRDGNEAVAKFCVLWQPRFCVYGRGLVSILKKVLFSS